jgi:hypothetical protein
MNSRFNFGRALHEYKEHYEAEKAWMVPARAIGATIHRDEATINRIIEDYKRADPTA